jgi:hypothetical protein
MECLQGDRKILKRNTVHVVMCVLKTRRAETEEMVIAREQFCKHVSTASNPCDSSNRYTCNRHRKYKRLKLGGDQPSDHSDE